MSLGTGRRSLPEILCTEEPGERLQRAHVLLEYIVGSLTNELDAERPELWKRLDAVQKKHNLSLDRRAIGRACAERNTIQHGTATVSPEVAAEAADALVVGIRALLPLLPKDLQRAIRRPKDLPLIPLRTVFVTIVLGVAALTFLHSVDTERAFESARVVGATLLNPFRGAIAYVLDSEPPSDMRERECIESWKGTWRFHPAEGRHYCDW